MVSIGTSVGFPLRVVTSNRARELKAQERFDLAMGALKRREAVTALAAQAGVSRKFVYSQSGGPKR